MNKICYTLLILLYSVCKGESGLFVFDFVYHLLAFQPRAQHKALLYQYVCYDLGFQHDELQLGQWLTLPNIVGIFFFHTVFNSGAQGGI